MTGVVETGGLQIEAIPTPGALRRRRRVRRQRRGSASRATCSSSDAVGGGPADVVPRLGDGQPDGAAARAARAAGPHRRDDDRPRVGAQPVRQLLARRSTPSSASRCASAGEEAELVVWSPDYDGKGKALVRFADGARRSSAARASSALSLSAKQDSAEAESRGSIPRLRLRHTPEGARCRGRN